MKMAQTILTGFDDVWVSSANYNTQKYSTNASEYRVFQFVIKRSVDGKLFFGYKVESLKANTVSVGVFDNGGGVYGSIQAKDKYGVIVGSSTGHDRTLSKWNNVDGNYAIMVYAVDDYPGVATVRYFGKHNAWGNDPDSNNLYVNIYYGSGVNLGGSFEITTTSISSYLNQIPTLSLSSPPNNLTLSEGNALPVAGEASDADANNNVVIKCQINNGPIRNIGSGVSDGVTPISFARTLTYHNKRLWDGAMDVAGADLAEDVDHILKVWAEDDQGGKSAEVTRKFRVIWNRPPTISGTNEDLGTIMEPPSKTYSVTDPEGNPFTIIEKIDGKVIRSFEGVPGREETVTIPHDMWIRLDLDTPHELTIEATDNNGMTSTRTYTFVRTETHIEFMLDFDNPDVEAHFTLDGMPKRVLVTLERYLPPGSSIEFVRVCNNAMDQSPTWEDMTAAVLAGRGHLFQNQQKTAQNWRINIWVCIAKGTATERVRLDGFGGAFD
jgi:hypothetical protein